MQKAIVQLHLVVWVEELVVLVDGALVVVIVGVLVVGVLQAVLVVSIFLECLRKKIRSRLCLSGFWPLLNQFPLLCLSLSSYFPCSLFFLNRYC